jgi:hypothetical protein
MKTTVLIILLLFNFEVSAQPPNQQAPWLVYGAGSFSCGKWLAARESKNSEIQNYTLQWVAGWIVSYNYYANETSHKSVQNPEFDTITAYIDKSCNDNPLHHIATVATEMIGELGGRQALHKRNVKKR